MRGESRARRALLKINDGNARTRWRNWSWLFLVCRTWREITVDLGPVFQAQSLPQGTSYLPYCPSPHLASPMIRATCTSH